MMFRFGSAMTAVVATLCLSLFVAGNFYGTASEKSNSIRSARQLNPAVPTVPFSIGATEFISDFYDTTADHYGNCGSGPVDSKNYDTCSKTCAVGWGVRDEWLEYDFEAPEDGNVDITVDIAAVRSTKVLAIEVDEVELAQWNPPDRGYGEFEDRVVRDVFLTAGSHKLKLLYVTSNINICSITVEYSEAPKDAPAPTPPPAPPAGSRIKMFHELGYFWQCDNVCDDSDNNLDFDPMWCLQCDGTTCDVGEFAKLRKCDTPTTTENTFFELAPTSASSNDFQIRAAGTNLCLTTENYTQRNPRKNTKMKPCNGSDNGQIWRTDGYGNFEGNDKFEVHPKENSSYCLTTQHHPKDGEDARVERCAFARKDVSNWWIKYTPE